MPTLFDAPAKARRTDPQSSHAAAALMNQGAVRSHNNIIIDAINIFDAAAAPLSWPTIRKLAAWLNERCDQVEGVQR